MASIYEISNRFLDFQRFIEESDPDSLPEEAIRDTFQGIEGEITEKVKEYAAVIKNMEGDIQPMKDAEKNIAARRKALENKVARMKAVCDQVMKLSEIEKIDDDPRFKIGYRKKPPYLEIIDEDALPDFVFVPQDPTIDRKLALDLLKDGKEIAGARMVTDEKTFFIK